MWLLKGLFLFVIISIFGLITLVSLIFFILKRKDNRKKKIWLTVFLSSCIISISLSIYTGIKVIGKFIDKTGSLIAEAGDGIHFGGLETYRYWAEK
jgi:cytochrome bd-type quinol oxidase subunit 2